MTMTEAPEALATAVLAIELDHFQTLVRPDPGQGDAASARLERLLGEFEDAQRLPAASGRGRWTLVLQAAPAALQAARARRLVERIAATDFAASGTPPLWLTASAGLALVERGASSFETASCAAEAALHVARRGGGNRVATLAADDPRAVARRADVDLLPQVLAAIREGRVVLDCQPIVPLPAGGTLQASAAVVTRLVTRSGEVLGSDRYLPAAVRHRCTSRLDLEVLARVGRWLETRAEAWVDLDFVLVPVHARSLEDPTFLDALRGRIDRAAFPRRRLCLEIVGSATIEDFTATRHALDDLHAMGCRLAFDEPACRAPVLAQFLSLPVDLVRLDARLAGTQPREATARGWLSALRDLCRASDRRTVAGPCDTPQVLDTVRRLGIDYAQGSAVCEPFPLERLLPARLVTAA